MNGHRGAGRGIRAARYTALLTLAALTLPVGAIGATAVGQSTVVGNRIAVTDPFSVTGTPMSVAFDQAGTPASTDIAGVGTNLVGETTVTLTNPESVPVAVKGLRIPDLTLPGDVSDGTNDPYIALYVDFGGKYLMRQTVAGKGPADRFDEITVPANTTLTGHAYLWSNRYPSSIFPKLTPVAETFDLAFEYTPKGAALPSRATIPGNSITINRTATAVTASGAPMNIDVAVGGTPATTNLPDLGAYDVVGATEITLTNTGNVPATVSGVKVPDLALPGALPEGAHIALHVRVGKTDLLRQTVAGTGPADALGEVVIPVGGTITAWAYFGSDRYAGSVYPYLAASAATFVLEFEHRNDTRVGPAGSASPERVSIPGNTIKIAKTPAVVDATGGPVSLSFSEGDTPPTETISSGIVGGSTNIAGATKIVLTNSGQSDAKVTGVEIPDLAVPSALGTPQFVAFYVDLQTDSGPKRLIRQVLAGGGVGNQFESVTVPGGGTVEGWAYFWGSSKSNFSQLQAATRPFDIRLDYTDAEHPAPRTTVIPGNSLTVKSAAQVEVVGNPLDGGWSVGEEKGNAFKIFTTVTLQNTGDTDAVVRMTKADDLAIPQASTYEASLYANSGGRTMFSQDISATSPTVGAVGTDRAITIPAGEETQVAVVLGFSNGTGPFRSYARTFDVGFAYGNAPTSLDATDVGALGTEKVALLRGNKITIR